MVSQSALILSIQWYEWGFCFSVKLLLNPSPLPAFTTLTGDEVKRQEFSWNILHSGGLSVESIKYLHFYRLRADWDSKFWLSHLLVLWLEQFTSLRFNFLLWSSVHSVELMRRSGMVHLAHSRSLVSSPLKMFPVSHENENPEVRDACGHPGEPQFILPMFSDLVFKSECPFCT